MHFTHTAHRILQACLEGKTPPASDVLALLEAATSEDQSLALEAGRALFNVLAEGLADRFEPGLSEPYAAIFARAIAAACPGLDPETLVERYHRVRRLRPFPPALSRVERVVVLSRVTLGADVAVTSVLLNAAEKRFPQARILFAGPEKNWQVFRARPRLQWMPVSYGKGGTLRDRLSVWEPLQSELSKPDTLVLDPDSRLTQLGLLPVCPEERYFLFESRAYGGCGNEPLPLLARRWAAEVFGVEDAAPFLAPQEQVEAPQEPFIVVNLGVGGNPAKRMPDPFEPDLLRGLAEFRMPLVVDLGFGEEEEARVLRAVTASGATQSIRLWRGSYAALTALISHSRLYVGYDSGGQHAAAAAGIPLVTIFAGFPSERMLARWTPWGPGPKQVIRVEAGARPVQVLERTMAAARRLIRGPIA